MSKGPFTTITTREWADMTDRIRKLEDVLKAAEAIPHHCQIPCALCDAVASLKADVKGPSNG